MYASYNNDIEFFIVYIREAHPNLLKKGNKTGVVGRPKNFDERIILATECVTKYKFTIPMVIDGMDGKVNNDYKAAPVRVTIVDIDGKVVFYAGRGPRDFRLSPVERTLKKLITYGGHMPLSPKPQWGQSVNGLRCGLAIDPKNFVLGEPVAAKLQFENTTREPINFYFQAADALKHIVIENNNRQILKMKASDEAHLFPRRERRNLIRKIAPGETFEMDIEGKIVSVSDQVAFATDIFYAVFDLKMNAQMLTHIESIPTKSVWAGKLTSGTFEFHVSAPTPSINQNSLDQQ